MIRRSHVAALIFLGLSLAATAASAQGVADTVVRWGLPGTWAVDCANPPSRQNTHTTFVARPDRTAYSARSWGDGGDTNEITKAALTADGLLVLTLNFPSLNQTRENTFMKGSDGRKRAMFNRQVGGDYSVRDGKFVDNGVDTPWQTRCN